MMGEISPIDDLRPFTGKIGNWLNERLLQVFRQCRNQGQKLELLAGLKEIVSEIEQVNEGKHDKVFKLVLSCCLYPRLSIYF